MHELCWWENTNRTKTLFFDQQSQNFIYSSLALGTLDHDKIDVMCIVHSYNMGDKIRKMRMNVALNTFVKKSGVA